MSKLFHVIILSLPKIVNNISKNKSINFKQQNYFIISKSCTVCLIYGFEYLTYFSLYFKTKFLGYIQAFKIVL